MNYEIDWEAWYRQYRKSYSFWEIQSSETKVKKE